MQAITLTTLAAFPDELEKHYAAFPSESVHWAPPSWEGVPSEPFTAIEQVCHVRDIEIEGYQRRFQRTLDEHQPLLESIDSEALAKARHYGSANAAVVLADFRRARADTVALLRSLDPQAFARRARFDGYGDVSVRSLMHYLCSHDQQHLAGLQWLLGKIG